MVNIHVNDNNNQVRINVPGINNTVSTQSSNPNNNVSSTIGNEAFYNGLAKEWAISPNLVQGIDYSSKYYAGKAKESADIAEGAIEDIGTAKNEAIGEINNTASDFEDDLTALTLRAETAATNAEDSATYIVNHAPTLTLQQTATGATYTATDMRGTTTVNILNGADGQDGQDGADGYSPTATVTQSGDVTTISITDKNGTTTESIDLSDKQDTLVSGTNIKTINNQSLLGSGNITIQGGGGGTEEVFIAEYGTTTYAEVMAALQSHKIVFVLKNGFLYIYQSVSGATNLFVRWGYSFAGSTNIDGVDTEGVYVNQNDVWYTTSNTFEFQQLLVSGTNIKTVNNQSILGGGNIDIQGGVSMTYDSTTETLTFA